MKVALKEVLPTKFLPYSRHVNEEVIALDSGDMMLTFELQGRAFETSDVRDLNDWTCNGFVPVTYLIMPPWLRTRAG